MVFDHFNDLYATNSTEYAFCLSRRRRAVEDPNLPMYREAFPGRFGVRARELDHVLRTSRSNSEAAQRIIRFFENGERLDRDPNEDDFQRRLDEAVAKKLAALGMDSEQIAQRVVQAIGASQQPAVAEPAAERRNEGTKKPGQWVEDSKSLYQELIAAGVAVNPMPEHPNAGYWQHVRKVYKNWKKTVQV